MIINMGPQHPSTHGVLRLLLELDGETVVTVQAHRRLPAHRHREEHRVPDVGARASPTSRAPTTSRPFFNELGYCLAVEKLLGVEAPPRAQVLRVLFNELNRISSHLVWLATGGLELGAVSVMLYGFREREVLMDIFEGATGPADEPQLHPHRRRDHGHRRRRAPARSATFLEEMPKRIDEYETPPEREPDLARAQRAAWACSRPRTRWRWA